VAREHVIVGVSMACFQVTCMCSRVCIRAVATCTFGYAGMWCLSVPGCDRGIAVAVCASHTAYAQVGSVLGSLMFGLWQYTSHVPEVMLPPDEMFVKFRSLVPFFCDRAGICHRLPVPVTFGTEVTFSCVVFRVVACGGMPVT